MSKVDAKDTGTEGFGPCEYMLIGLSYFLVVITFPFSICCSLKVTRTFKYIFVHWIISNCDLF